MTSTTLPGPILAATDFSALARHAAERAAHLAHETETPLTLMHVLPGGALEQLREWLGAGHPLEQQLHEEADRHLGALAAELQTHGPATVSPVLSTGSPLVEIGRQCEDQDVSLLVVGARGSGFLRQLVLGSTSERLLRRTRRPMLIVRHRPHDAYRHVLVALDFSPWSAHAIELARQVAPGARLLLFNAYQVPFESKLRYAGVDAATIEHYRHQARADALQRVLSLADSTGLKAGEWAPCIVEGDPSQRLIEQEQEQDCDLVVLGKHGRSVTEDMLLGSVSKHVLAEGSTDVLVSTAHES